MSIADLARVNPVVVDVDSIVYAFSSLFAYRPTTPFKVNVAGGYVLSKKIKLLNGIFGSGW